MKHVQNLRREVEETFKNTEPGSSPALTLEELHSRLKKRGLTNRLYKTRILIKSLVKNGQLQKTTDGKYQEKTE